MLQHPSLRKQLVLVAAAVCSAASLWAVPNSNDPYAGQYDVLTTPKYSANEYRQGELIVKFRTENVAAPVRLKGAKARCAPMLRLPP